jgi:putative membrane protein
MTIQVFSHYFHWFLAFHIISFTAWMAGMFYLPRLYVYHCQTTPGTAESERFKVMEVKLLRLIINPAMIATYLFGILLILTPGAVNWHAAWWWTKLICVALMTVFHIFLSRWRRDFLNDRNTRPEKFYRMANEIPTVLFIIIVLVVVA